MPDGKKPFYIDSEPLPFQDRLDDISGIEQEILLRNLVLLCEDLHLTGKCIKKGWIDFLEYREDIMSQFITLIDSLPVGMVLPVLHSGRSRVILDLLP